MKIIYIAVALVTTGMVLVSNQIHIIHIVFADDSVCTVFAVHICECIRVDEQWTQGTKRVLCFRSASSRSTFSCCGKDSEGLTCYILTLLPPLSTSCHSTDK
jgi:hypothetical protein